MVLDDRSNVAVAEVKGAVRLTAAVPVSAICSTFVTFANAAELSVTEDATDSVSVPSPPLTVSDAVKLTPNMMLSSPAPPSMLSLPVPAVIVSLPAPPVTTLLPFPVSIVSLPAPPSMLSLPVPPFKVS